MATVVRWTPIRELTQMQDAMDRLFDEAWRGTRRNGENGTGYTFPFDLHESDTAYTIFAELPGVNPDQINISVRDGVLTINAEAFQPSVEEEARVLRQERVFGHFSRSIRLPEHVNPDEVEAVYENGVLALTLPKAPEAQPRTIPVKRIQHTN